MNSHQFETAVNSSRQVEASKRLHLLLLVVLLVAAAVPEQQTAAADVLARAMADASDEQVVPTTKQCFGHVDVLNLLTIIIQNFNRHGVRAPMLAPLKLGDALHYKSNVTSLLRTGFLALS